MADRNSKLRERRRAVPLSQEELADRAHVSVMTLRRWESGTVRPQPEHQRRLCDVLGSTPEELGFAEGTRATIPESLLDSGMLEWLASAASTSTADIARAVLERVDQVAPLPPYGSRSGLAPALLRYYGEAELARSGFLPYRVQLGGAEVATSIISRPDWIGRDVPLQPVGWPDPGPGGERCQLARIAPAPETPITSAVVDAALDRLARSVQAAQGDRPILWDKPLYRLVSLSMSRGLEATFALDRFAHYALTYDLLEAEIMHALQEGSADELPLRDTLLPGVDQVAGRDARLCVGGPLGLLAIARRRPGDFLLVVQRRSSRVLNVPGMLAVIPKGFHQHLVNAAEEVNLGTSLRRELEEELLGRVDYDEIAGRGRLGLDPYSTGSATPAMAWLEEHRACTLRCVSAGLNLLSGNYEFASLVTIHDEAFWDLFGGACLPNWEAAEVQTYSSRDAFALAELVADPRWTEEGLFALVEGLRGLARQHPDRVSIPPQLEVVAA